MAGTLPNVVSLLPTSLQAPSSSVLGVTRARDRPSSVRNSSHSCRPHPILGISSPSPSLHTRILASKLPYANGRPNLEERAGSRGMGTRNAISTDTEVVTTTSVEPPSWDELRALVAERDLPIPHLWEKQENPDARILFYRDTNAWCPYCQRVWVQLEEKGIPYNTKLINLRDKPDWFLEMNPKGLTPTAIIDGEVVTESLRIMLLIEQKFRDQVPLLPSNMDLPPVLPSKEPLDGIIPTGDERIDQLLKIDAALLTSWFAYARAEPGSDGDSKREAFEQAVDEVEKELAAGGGPYFLGESFSIVDAVALPGLLRVGATVKYFKGLDVRNNDKYPALRKWFQAVNSRPSVQAVHSTDYTYAHTIAMIANVKVEGEEAEAAAKLIDEEPLKADLSSPTALDPANRLGAGAKLATNGERVVDHALRNINQTGDAYREAADTAYRVLAVALLQGTEAASKVIPSSLFEADERFVSDANPKALPALAAAQALDYTRKRICVPRDLNQFAAYSMQAHINWLLPLLSSTPTS